MSVILDLQGFKYNILNNTSYGADSEFAKNKF